MFLRVTGGSDSFDHLFEVDLVGVVIHFGNRILQIHVGLKNTIQAVQTILDAQCSSWTPHAFHSQEHYLRVLHILSMDLFTILIYVTIVLHVDFLSQAVFRLIDDD